MYTANFHSTILYNLCFVNQREVERLVKNSYLMWLGDELLQNALWLAHKIAVEASLKKGCTNQFFGDKYALVHQE
jgi:hypothetical protein